MMNEYPIDGYEYAAADQHYSTNQTAAFEQETDDFSDLDGEPDELEEVPAGEDSAKGRAKHALSDDVCAPLCRSAVVCRFRKTSVKPASVMNTFDPRSDSI